MTVIVAEAGINHGGDIDRAKRLVEAASKSGAHVVKFQYYSPATLEPPGPDRDLLASCALDLGDLITLRQETADHGLKFACTAFDVKSAKILCQEVAPTFVKLASGTLYWELLQAVHEYPWVVISTGMSGMAVVEAAVNRLKNPQTTTTIMQCTSAYPCPWFDVNIKAMDTIRQAFRCEVGLSDHSPGPVACIVAAAYGANMVEKHIMLDDNGTCPDKAVSLKPKEFLEMVGMVNAAQQVLGDGRKMLRPSEHKTVDAIGRREQWRISQS